MTGVRVVREVLRALFAALVLISVRFVHEQVVLEVGHPGLPDEARGDLVLLLWVGSIAALLVYGIYAPWIGVRIATALLLSAPLLLGALLLTLAATVGGPDARSHPPPAAVLAFLAGTCALGLPGLLWIGLEWRLRVEAGSSRAGAVGPWIGLLLVAATAAASVFAWEVVQERKRAFEQRRHDAQELLRQKLEPSPSPSP